MTDETGPEPFIPVDENWDRALCVVAHPDDLEFGAGTLRIAGIIEAARADAATFR